MDKDDEPTDVEIKRMTADIVSAFVKSTSVSARDLPKIIRDVSNTLADLASLTEPAGSLLTPAVPVERSVTRSYIICLEDGKRFKVLKSHLRTAYNMTPDEYRQKWGLADDYPMVAPGYAARRSAIAKRTGLGRREAVSHPDTGDDGSGSNRAAAFQAA